MGGRAKPGGMVRYGLACLNLCVSPNFCLNDSRSSLYAWGSDEIFGTSKPGMVIDYTTDFMSLMNAPRQPG